MDPQAPEQLLWLTAFMPANWSPHTTQNGVDSN